MLPGKNPDQLYVVLEIKEDVERLRADIKALNTGSFIHSVNTVLLNDLEVIEVDTADLLGHKGTINKADYSQVIGKVVKVSEQKHILAFTKGIKVVETNSWLTIQEENSTEHTRTLCVNKQIFYECSISRKPNKRFST